MMESTTQHEHEHIAYDVIDNVCDLCTGTQIVEVVRIDHPQIGLLHICRSCLIDLAYGLRKKKTKKRRIRRNLKCLELDTLIQTH